MHNFCSNRFVLSLYEIYIRKYDITEVWVSRISIQMRNYSNVTDILLWVLTRERCATETDNGTVGWIFEHILW